MYYNGLNNIVSIAIGITIVLTGSIIAYIFQKKLFKKWHKK